MRKDWKKPELIILSRSNPEEAVLAFCKSSISPFGAGPLVNCDHCMQLFFPVPCTEVCSLQSAS